MNYDERFLLRAVADWCIRHGDEIEREQLRELYRAAFPEDDPRACPVTVNHSTGDFSHHCFCGLSTNTSDGGICCFCKKTKQELGL